MRTNHVENAAAAKARAWEPGSQHLPTMVAAWNAYQVAVFYARQFAR